jgi:CDP-glucose 4,6-dehydratase
VESLGLNADFWQGRRVFITGHTGFKGSWLCLWLRALNAEVTGYALDPPSEPNLFAVARVADLIRDERGDIADTKTMSDLMRRERCEIVLHLAAQSLVRRSYESPLETFQTNVIGTASVLDAIRATPSVRAAVIVTSDKCYDLRQARVRHREDDPLGGDDPYSASKAAAEYVTAGYRFSFWSVQSGQPAVATARSGNVIGGGDWSRDRLLPDVIAAFEAGKPALIRNPEAVRPWQHVVDPLSGYLMLAERLCGRDGAEFAGAWNFGPPADSEWTVGAIADEAAHLYGPSAAWRRDTAEHPHEAPELRLDSSKARDRLSWQPRVSLPVALRQTITWHKRFAAGMDARTLVNGEIEALTLRGVGS